MVQIHLCLCSYEIKKFLGNSLKRKERPNCILTNGDSDCSGPCTACAGELQMVKMKHDIVIMQPNAQKMQSMFK